MLYCVTNKAVQCRELECRPTFTFAQRKWKKFPEGKSTPMTLWIWSNGLTPPPPVFIAFLGLLKMSSSCQTCRPGPTGPNSSYATDNDQNWQNFQFQIWLEINPGTIFFIWSSGLNQRAPVMLASKAKRTNKVCLFRKQPEWI